MALVCVPLTAELLRAWADGAAMPGQLAGHADTPGLREAFGIDEEEEAERVALLVASVAGLVTTGRRLVAVVEAAAVPRDGGDPDFGEVSFPVGSYSQVTALFADEPGAAAAAAAVAGMPLAQAWDDPAVTGLLSEADLLWHGPGEWSALIAG